MAKCNYSRDWLVIQVKKHTQTYGLEIENGREPNKNDTSETLKSQKD